MGPLKSLLHRFLILCCALYLGGAHWVALQATAWTGMLISRSVDQSVAEAIETTFDGKHPCKACELIEEGKHAEERSQTDLEVLKKAGEVKFLKFLVLQLPLRNSSVAVAWPKISFFGVERFEAPPTPPPLA